MLGQCLAICNSHSHLEEYQLLQFVQNGDQISGIRRVWGKQGRTIKGAAWRGPLVIRVDLFILTVMWWYKSARVIKCHSTRHKNMPQRPVCAKAGEIWVKISHLIHHIELTTFLVLIMDITASNSPLEEAGGWANGSSLFFPQFLVSLLLFQNIIFLKSIGQKNPQRYR